MKDIYTVYQNTQNEFETKDEVTYTGSTSKIIETQDFEKAKETALNIEEGQVEICKNKKVRYLISKDKECVYIGKAGDDLWLRLTLRDLTKKEMKEKLADCRK